MFSLPIQQTVKTLFIINDVMHSPKLDIFPLRTKRMRKAIQTMTKIKANPSYLSQILKHVLLVIL